MPTSRGSAFAPVHGEGPDPAVEVAAGEFEQLVEARADAEIRGGARIGRLEELLRHQERDAQHGPFLAHFIERHHRFRRTAHHRADVHVRRRLPRVDADLRQVLHLHHVRQGVHDAHRPGPHVGHLHAVLALLRIRLDPARLVSPAPGLGALALLHRESDERDAECVGRLLVAFRPLVQRLVQYVVVRAPQPPPDDLLGEQRRAEGPEPEDVGHAPSFHGPPCDRVDTSVPWARRRRHDDFDSSCSRGRSAA